MVTLSDLGLTVTAQFGNSTTYMRNLNGDMYTVPMI